MADKAVAWHERCAVIVPDQPPRAFLFISVLTNSEQGMLRYWTAGESHGKGILAVVDGFPCGIALDTGVIDRELERRQGGYGRGGRQRLEQDRVEVLSGTWRGVTLGSPIALWVKNNDYKIEKMEDLDRPRPGQHEQQGRCDQRKQNAETIQDQRMSVPVGTIQC